MSVGTDGWSSDILNENTVATPMSPAVVLAGKKWRFELATTMRTVSFFVHSLEDTTVCAATSIVVRLNGVQLTTRSDEKGPHVYAPRSRSGLGSILTLADLPSLMRDHQRYESWDCLSFEITVTVFEQVVQVDGSQPPSAEAATASTTTPTAAPTTAPATAPAKAPTARSGALSAAPAALERFDWNRGVAALLFNPLYADGAIDVGGERVPVHLFVLSVQAPALVRHFGADRIAVLSAVKMHTVKRMLRFLYTGHWQTGDAPQDRKDPTASDGKSTSASTSLASAAISDFDQMAEVADDSDAEIAQLIALAADFEAGSLFNACCNHLAHSLSLANIVGRLVMARQGRLRVLHELCLQWMAADPRRLQTILGMASAADLTRQDVLDVLGKILSAATPPVT